MRSLLMFLSLLAMASFSAVVVSAQDAKPAEGDHAPKAEAAKPEAEHQEPKKESDDHATPGDAHAKPSGDGAHAAEGGHGAVDHDLSHNNGSASLNSPEEWKYDLAIWTVVVFLILMAILGKFAWGPISEGLEKREHSIENMIADAKRNQEEAKALLANYESKLAAQQEEYREMIAQGRREGEAVAARIVSDAQAAATRERERSVTEIEQAKNVALGEIAAKSVDVAMGLAGKIVRRQITGEDQRTLLHEAVEGIASRN